MGATRASIFKSRRLNERIVHTLSHLLLLLGAVTTTLPLFWMVSASLMQDWELAVYPPRWIPERLMWENYGRVFTVMPFARFALNSVKLAVLSTVGTLLSCSLAAYSFARLRFPGRDKIFLVLLATMMIPGAVRLVPVYIIFTRLGWVDTHLPLWVPSFLGGAYGIFLIRQFYLTLPQELMDAAKIDGCNPFSTYWRIVLPLGGPVHATLGLFACMGSWNSLMGPLIYLNSTELFTLPIGLTYFRGHQWAKVDWTGLMAGCVITVLPILLLFVLTQRYFVRGIVLTGLKV